VRANRGGGWGGGLYMYLSLNVPARECFQRVLRKYHSFRLRYRPVVGMCPKIAVGVCLKMAVHVCLALFKKHSSHERTMELHTQTYAILQTYAE